MDHWWNHPQRIVQTNLRLIDASLDPEALAGDLKAFGATAMLFNVGGIFAWYPTSLELQPVNPKLGEDRNLLDRMIAAAHERDIKVIGRYDLSKGTAVAYQAHPDWFCVDADGHPFEYNGTYQACVNGGWYHNQGVEVLKETLARYEIDGLFFNMFGYLAVDYSLRSYGLCHCENCRQGFANFAGAELPERRDLSDPLYRRYLQFQDHTSTELAQSIYDVVKSIRPDVGVSNMGKKSDFFRGEVNRRLDRPQPEWVHYSGEQARNFQSLGSGRIRHSSALTHFIDFPWRYSAETAAGQALRLAQQLANGADPHYYFMGLPNQRDRKPLPAVKSIFAMHAKNQELYSDLQSESRIALYCSHKSRRYFPEAGTALSAFRGAYRALLEAGVVFDLIHDARTIDADFLEAHKRYDTIVLAGAGCMSETEAAALDAYVEAGGSLLVIGAAGTHDETGNAVDGVRLKAQPFTKMTGSFDARGGYMQAKAGEIGGLDSELVLLDGPYREVVPKPEAETSYPILLPQRFGPPELCFAEEGLQSDLPGTLVAPYGEGHCAYIPFNADVLYYEQSLAEHRELIVQLANRFARPARVAISDPTRVELTVHSHRQTGDLLIHIINYSGHNGNSYAEPVHIHGLELRLNGVNASECRALVAGAKMTTTKGVDGGMVVKLPTVGYFEAISIASGT